METRKIIIVDSGSNQNVTVQTDATTFGELKKAARAAGINYEGKEWLEGITRTSPMDDNSLLPTNVPYKGAITNNLVYMLTNTNKKIKSGLTRKEIYAKIVELDIAEKVKEEFGRNYTQVANNLLEEVIAKATSLKEGLKKKTAPKKPVVDYKEKYDGLVATLAKFVATIPEDTVQEVLALSKTLAPEVAVQDVEFSDAELKDLFKD